MERGYPEAIDWTWGIGLVVLAILVLTVTLGGCATEPKSDLIPACAHCRAPTRKGPVWACGPTLEIPEEEGGCLLRR